MILTCTKKQGIMNIKGINKIRQNTPTIRADAAKNVTTPNVPTMHGQSRGILFIFNAKTPSMPFDQTIYAPVPSSWGGLSAFARGGPPFGGGANGVPLPLFGALSISLLLFSSSLK